MSGKPGRNDPCPCGSGKKFKKCCADKFDVRLPAQNTAPTSAELNQLAELFNAGHHAELEHQAHLLVEQYPDSGIIWNVLGAALQLQGKNALPSLRKAATLLPDDAEAHYNLGVTLRNLGQLDDAVASYRRSLEIKPDYAEAHCNLGVALQELGWLDDAAASYRLALVIKPDFADAHYNLGVVLQSLGQLDDAVASCRQALEIKPEFSQAHYSLGNALQQLGQLDDAIASYHKALEINPDYADVHNNLGNALSNLDRLEEAVACYRRVLEITPNFAEVHSNLGAALQDLGQLESAAESYRRALEIKPDFAGAHSNLGGALMELGKADEAEESLNKAIELAPDDAKSLSTALLYIPYRQDDHRFSQLETVYSKRDSLPMKERITLNFAMGKAMENIGQCDRSFSALEEGNRLHYQAHPFDEAQAEQFLENSCNIFTADLFEKCAFLAGRLPPAHDERVPIFIVGMLRSGSTLIEQILASHPRVYGAGELAIYEEIAKKAEKLFRNSTNEKAPILVLRELGQEYLDRVWKLAPDARYITDKMLGNYQYLGLIHLMLPNAKIIHSMRDPMDTCFSCYAVRFTFKNEYSYDLGTMGRHYLRYKKLMQHWHNVLPPSRILDVRYEDNIADLEREARRMLDYLGLPWDPACLRFYETERTIRTASVAQVRKPIYSNSVSRWKNFEKHLGPLLEIIHPTLVLKSIFSDE
jgi:tetratricopeptide (TPR) repeat protein